MRFCCLYGYICHAKGVIVIALSIKEKSSLKKYLHLGMAGTIYTSRNGIGD